MKELGRILSNPRLLFGLVLIILLNALLFVRDQSAKDYGLDCSMPTSSILVFDGSIPASDSIDAKKAYAHYLDWIGQTKPLPLSEAISTLEQEKARLHSLLSGPGADEYAKLEYIAVNSLLSQAEYLASYGGWLNIIQKNKDNMLEFPIFNDPNSFSGRNILKTAEEFEKLQGVELTLGADGAIDALMSFPLTDYLLLVILLLFCISFLEERKKGLWGVVHAAPNGRRRLAIYRTAILFGVSACGVLLLYGTNLALGFYLYGGVNDLGRPLQSVELLGRLPVLGTVGSFLTQYFLLRIAAAFFVSLLLWLLLTAVNHAKYTIITAAGVLAAEYGLYTFLPVQSGLNGLKYFNLFTYISLSDLYTNYLNIDLFGYPLEIRSISQLALLPLCGLTAAACVLIHCHKKPAAGTSLLGRIAYGINTVTDMGLRHLRLFGMELYKTLWLQKGIVVAALLVYLVTGTSFTAKIPIYNPAEVAAQQYTEELAGEITDDTFIRIGALEAELDQTIADYEAAKLAHENGELADNQLNLYAYYAGTARTSKEGLSLVRSQAEELFELGTKKGFTPWLIEQTPFESVFGTAAQSNQHQAAIIAVLALTLLLAGSMAYERHSGMTFLLGAVPRGRGAFLIRKILLALLVAVAVWATVYGMELYALVSIFSIQAWNVPVQNLSMMAHFPFPCSIKGWLVILYGYRLLTLSCGAILVLFISNCAQRMEIAYIAGCGIMLVPSLLYAYVGIELFRPLSYITSVEAVPLLSRENGSIAQFSLWGLALAIIAGLASVWLFASDSIIKGRRR